MGYVFCIKSVMKTGMCINLLCFYETLKIYIYILDSVIQISTDWFAFSYESIQQALARSIKNVMRECVFIQVLIGLYSSHQSHDLPLSLMITSAMYDLCFCCFVALPLLYC